ncbi:hypothetical protein ACWNPK_20920 [Bacillus atrophaeus]
MKKINMIERSYCGSGGDAGVVLSLTVMKLKWLKITAVSQHLNKLLR